MEFIDCGGKAAVWVPEIDWVAVSVDVEVQADWVGDWVGTEEAPSFRIVVAGAHPDEAGGVLRAALPAQGGGVGEECCRGGWRMGGIAVGGGSCDLGDGGG